MRTACSYESEGWGKMRSLLSQVRILRSCTGADLGKLGRSAHIGRYESDEIIAEQSDVPTSVCLVAFGRVRLKLFADNGRELILSEVDAGGFFGDESLGGAPTRRASAFAIEDVTVVSIPADAFASFLSEQPRVALNFAIELSGQLHTACDSVAAFGLLTVEERLIRTLERLAQERGSTHRDGRILHERPTHSELAAQLGACRETVTRAFNSLSRRGLVVPSDVGLLLTRSDPGGRVAAK